MGARRHRGIGTVDVDGAGGQVRLDSLSYLLVAPYGLGSLIFLGRLIYQANVANLYFLATANNIRLMRFQPLPVNICAID